MKHFSIDPLTSLIYSTPQTPSPALLEAALTSILATNETAMEGISGADEAKEKIVSIVDDSRTKIEQQYKSVKVAFNLTRLMQLFFVKEGYKGLGWNLENDLCAIFGGMFLKRKEKSGALERSLGHLKLIVK
jgi:origin recognition complex subunit 3